MSGAQLAQTAVALGLPVFPCGRSKTPAKPKREGGRGYLDATTDPEAIERLFAHRNARLIGVPCGERSGFDVLDLDYDKGAGEWEEANRHRIPETRVHQSQSGGRHLLFRHVHGVRNSQSSIALGVDVRGEGGYVVFPPSKGYSVIADAEIADWPDWLLELVLKKQHEAKPERDPAKPYEPISDRFMNAVVERALASVRSAPDGMKHVTLRNQALLLGGLLHYRLFTGSEACQRLVNALPASVRDWELAKATASWGLEHGAANPIELPPREITARASGNGFDPRPEPPPPPADPEPVIERLTELGLDEGAQPTERPAPFLSASSPVDSAREFISRLHTTDEQRTLLHRQGSFYTWARSHYVEHDQEEIRAALYGFLHSARTEKKEGELVAFNPTKRKVADVLEATAAVAQLDRKHRPPCWLKKAETDSSFAPAEIIACSNTLLHLPTGKQLDHTPAFFTTNALTFAYQPAAPAPAEWLKFLRTIWPNDQQAIDTLQEFFGLALTGETKYQKALLIVGPKRSGKGTLARVLTQLLGQDNVASPTLSGIGTNFGLAPLIGKRLAIISDARLSGKADQQVIAERILSISGEDALTIDRKNRAHWTGRLDARFLILTNELPRLSDASGALASRFIILKMDRSFYGNEDLGLGDRLLGELPSILLWAIEGWKRLTNRGNFIPPASSAAAVQELEDLSSPIGAFLRERCIVGAGHSVRVDDLYRAWCDWCRTQGRDHPGTVQGFGRDLGAAISGLETTNRRDGEKRFRYYEGVGFNPQNMPTAERDGTHTTAMQAQHYDDVPPPSTMDLAGF